MNEHRPLNLFRAASAEQMLLAGFDSLSQPTA
jgi:hypothetical protein